MLSSLIAGIARGFRGTWRRKELPPRDFHRPQLESLEERLVLSETTTTIPAFADIPSIIGIPDVIMAALPKGNPSVIFLGDSISYGFAYGTGSAIWSAIMAPLGAADFGVSGQTTESMLFQISLGQLVGINPSVVVLDIGGNNLLHGDSPQATADGILANVNTIHQYLPQAQVLVLGILPGKPTADDPYRALGSQTNALVAQRLAGNVQTTFLDLGSHFVQPDGTISTSLMYDYIHPTALGYLEMTSALLPAIEQIGLVLVPAPAQTTDISMMPA
jgi:lysophospholipase L1-like esterase